MRPFLEDSLKTFTTDLDKAAHPRDTIKRVKECLGNVGMDILKETRRIDKGRLGIPVYISICGAEARATIGTHKQMGKGASVEQAEASSLMELMERFSLFSFMKGSFICSSAAALEGDKVPFENIISSVHDNTLNSDKEFDKALKFWSDLPLYWTQAVDLANGRNVWMPIQWFYSVNEFNGSSAGNTVAEAVVQGLCEVVERHVSSIISYDQVVTPVLETDTLTDKTARDLLAKFQARGMEVHIKDFTMDMGIPTVGALAMDPSTFPNRSEIVYTAGTATDPQKAFIRALTEIAQLAGDFDTEGKYAESGLPKFNKLDEAGYVIGKKETIPIRDLPNVSDINHRVEVEKCVEALKKRSFPVYAVDISHSALGIPAVYMIIPGNHFRERTRGNSVCLHAAKLISQFPDGQRAVHELEKMRKLYSEHYSVHFFLGYAYEQVNRYSEALECYTRALELDTEGKERASAYCHKAVCHKEEGDYARALDELEKAASYNAELKEIHNLMGFCHFKMKDHMKSIACFEKAIELDPSSAIDYANIGSNLRELGHLTDAVRWYQFALEIDPGIEFASENIEKLRKQISN